MILCVNLNAAIDKTVTVERLAPGAIHRPSSVVALPGGKGCNVARALKTLGEQPLVTGWAGGYAGRFIEQGLREEGIACAFVPAPIESRTCLSILDLARGALTELYEAGDPIPRAAQSAFLARWSQLLARADFVTLSGSLPPGVPDDFYARLITAARRAKVPVALDTSGEALRRGLAARPDLVKPNRSELAALLGRDLKTLAEVAQAAGDLALRRRSMVVVSLGKAGAVAAGPHTAWRVQPIKIEAKSAVGSGDAMLAGLVAGLVHGADLPEALRQGAAAGAANALSLGAGRFSRRDVQSLARQIQIRPLRRFV